MFKVIKRLTIYQYIKQLIFRYNDDDLAAMSAQVSYYLILAFFPFLFFLINLLSFTPIPNRLLTSNLSLILPQGSALVVNNILVHTLEAKSTTILVLGMLGSLWAASRGMAAIIRGLNHSYGVKENRSFLTLALIALMSVIGLTGIIISSFFMLVLGRIIGSYIFDLVGAKTLFYSVWTFLRYALSLILMIITFYLMYRYLPNRRLKFNHIIVGTLFTTFGWILGSLVFSYYINHFGSYELIYGSLGGVFALIVWLYISTLIFLLGAELNVISSNLEKMDKL
ncbi:YihY/virulence factor BrkB family protein [bacterium BFN5]|nr:YihY/virulence factor BrkB family protein [bacterium BFN5]